MQKPLSIKRILRSGLIYLFILIILSVVNSCNKEEVIQPEKEELTKDLTALDYIKNLGFKESQIQDLGDKYLVDGDILFSKKLPQKIKSTSKGKISQYYTGHVISPNINIISINVQGMNSYLTQIEKAIEMWNTVPNVRLYLEVWDGTGSPHITIKENRGMPQCGTGDFPFSDPTGEIKPGAFININTKILETQYNSDVQIIGTIAHEIGHTLGFIHTNFDPSIEPTTNVPGATPFTVTHIIGTPLYNPQASSNFEESRSIMIGGCGTSPERLSTGDVQAYQTLYPIFNQPPTVSITNPANGSSIPPGSTTIQAQAIDYDGQISKVEFFAGATKLGEDLTSPYSFSWDNIAAGNYSITAKATDNSGHVSTSSQVNIVVGTSTTAPVPVYVFYHTYNGDHVFSTNRQVVIPSYGAWGYEGIAFYAFPNQASGTVPIYEYYHQYNGDHFYTTNSNAVPLSQNGWHAFGITYYAFSNPGPGRVPLYAFYHNYNGDHYYSTNPNAVNVSPGNWEAHGLAFYVYPAY